MQFHWNEDRRRLSVKAPAKINLYLEIHGRRPDGYHEIDTLMQAVSLYDELEFRSEDEPGTRLEVKAGEGFNDDELPSADSDNLVFRAAEAIRREALRAGASPAPGLHIVLRKYIPMGAGLGGGSSDAAATLLGLCRLWGLELSDAILESCAAELGSDVAFFLYGGLARCQGRGEIVFGLPESNLSERFYYVLVAPPVHVSTSLIYKDLREVPVAENRLTTPEPLATMNFKSIRAALRNGQLLHNRLQNVAFRCFPELELIYQLMKNEAFRGVQLTGSGAALFGVVENPSGTVAREGVAANCEGIAERLRHRLSRIEKSKGDLRGDRDDEREGKVFVVSGLPAWSSRRA